MKLRGNSRITPAQAGGNLKLWPRACVPRQLRLFVNGLLITLFGALTGCQNPDRPPPLAAAHPAHTGNLRLDFGGVSLLAPEKRRNTAPPADLSGYPAHLLRSPGWPAIQYENGQLCLQSQNDFYHDLEAGLRFAFCRPASADQAAQIQRLLAEISRSENRTAYPVYQDEQLRISVSRLAPLKARLGKIALSVDGGSPGEALFLKSKGLAGVSAFTALPRRFPVARAHYLVAGARLVLLYPLPRDINRFLNIELNTDGLAAAFRRGMARLPAVRTEIETAASTAPARATEIYFAAQGKAGDEWLEISGPEHNARLQYEVRNDNGTVVRGERFVFAYSSLLLDRARGLSFSDHLRVGQHTTVETIEHERLVDRGAGRYRSLTRATFPSESESVPFEGARHCWTGAQCGSPGLHPAIVQKLTPAQQPGTACTAADLRLSEWNPFGIVSGSNRIDPGGKFIELQVRRACATGKLLLRAGDQLLDPGFHSLKSGELLVFAASDTYFSSIEEPGRARLLFDSRLRSLQAEHSIVALELGAATAPEKPDTPENNPREVEYYVADSPAIHFVSGERHAPGSDSGTQDPAILRRVHSLIPAGTNEKYPRFHRASNPDGSLRPDIARTHAMSPGRVPAPEPATSNASIRETDTDGDNDGQPRLSEVMPAGVYDAAGISRPGQEFIEIDYPAGNIPRDESLLLDIEDERDGTRRLYLLPGPGTQTRSADILPGENRKLVWSRDEPACWQRTPGWLRDDALRLPNGAGLYTLRTNDGSIIDRLRIDSQLYATLTADARRRSLGYVAAADRWRPAAGLPPLAHACGPHTAGTPGESPSFAPFLRFSSGDPQHQAFRLHSADSASTFVAWRLGNRLDQAHSSGRESLFDGDILSIALPPGSHGRLLLEALPESPTAAPESLYLREIFPGPQELYFETIAPSPPGGGHEWIRICSRDGYQASASESLHLYDSSTSDKIVPYSARFDGPLPLPLSGANLALEPGACALLIDPDFSTTTTVYRPVLRGEDRQLWTIQTSATLGNGLAAGEGLLLKRHTGVAIEPGETVASYGRPDTPRPFGLSTSAGERVRRKPDTPGIRFDTFANWEVLP